MTDEDATCSLPEAERILQYAHEIENEIDSLSEKVIGAPVEIPDCLSDDSTDDRDSGWDELEEDVLAILNEFSRRSSLSAWQTSLPKHSILATIHRQLKNENPEAMVSYNRTVQSDRGLDTEAIALPVSVSSVKPSGFFESPVFGSGDVTDDTEGVFTSLDNNFNRLLSDPLHGDMTSASLMQNWIHEDEEDEIELLSGSVAEGEGFDDTLALDGEHADRSPIDHKLTSRFLDTPSDAAPPFQSPLSQAPSLPMMLRQEERPARKGSMGRQTKDTVTPSTGHPLSEYDTDNLHLTPPNATHSPMPKMNAESLGVFSPGQDRITTATPHTPGQESPPLASSAGGARLIDTPSSPLPTQVVDSSVLGDYCHWTAGPRLTAPGIRQLYSGLYATALDEAEAGMGGKMAEENYKKSGSSGKKSSIGGQTPGNSNPSGIGAVAGTAAALLPMLLGGIRNKQGSTAGNSPMARHTGEDHGGEVSTLQPSIADPAGGEKHRTSVRSVRVLEVVCRPDVPLKELMTMCYKASRAAVLRCTMSQNCHMILETTPQEGKGKEYTGKGGWNTIDIQVCVSKELRQRVVVLQFLLVDTTRNGPSKALVTRSPAQYQQFLVNIQRLFTSSHLSLSGLYKAPVKDTTIVSLDSHFIEQLRNVCREDMWSVLRAQISEMDIQIKEAEELSGVLVEAIEPIYRQHGVDTDVLSQLKASVNDEDATSDAAAGGDHDESGPALEERKAGMEGCLLLLEYHKRRFQRRYDRELTHRLRKRLASTISICERLGDYRRSVLRALSEHPLTKASSLAKAFSAAFDGLEVTSSAESEGLYLKYNAITESEIGSSNDSSGSGGSGSTEGIEKESYVAIGGGNPLSPVASTTRGPVLKPSSLPRRRESDEEYDDMFTSPRPARESTMDISDTDKTFLTPPAQVVPKTPKTIGSSVATFTSAAKSWWYGSGATAENTVTEVSDSESDIVLVQRTEERKKKLFSFYVIGHREVVLYCCACLVSTMPGYLYLTPTLLCLAARIPGISKVHEAYHLADVHEVTVQSNKGTYSAMAYSLVVSLFKPNDPLHKELYITPAVVDCKILKVILDEARDMLLR